VHANLEKNPTDAERKLWYWLRLRQCKGFKFRRQFPMGHYIVDFICLDAKLIIEADGGEHNTLESILYDKNRTTELEKLGYKVIRFWNDEILTQIEVVLESIFQVLKE
jgi:very-short-patch-repair endonuclease